MSTSSGSRTLNPANVMTALRVLLVPVIIVLLLVDTTSASVWALIAFIVASLTDTADGWLARRRGEVTRWGKLADPAADKILVLGVLAALVVTGDVPWWVLAIIALRELAVTVQRQVLLRRDIVMAASIWGKLKTVSQLIAICLVIAPFVPDRSGMAALYVAVALTIGSGLDYAVRGARRASAAS
ncbi:MAG TPA: CDP-diacylglycerol--glycerol-3-phosphate 3-phosphatidyltransferase [Euzebyales bacterium]